MAKSMPWTRQRMNLEERAYRVALLWSHGLRSFDATDIFDYQNACHVNRDYRMYLKAKTSGLNSVGNPPTWLCRMINREKGMHPILLQKLKTELNTTQLMAMAVMTRSGMSYERTAKLFGISKQAMHKNVQKGARKLAEKLGITINDVKSIIESMTNEDWLEVGVDIG